MIYKKLDGKFHAYVTYQDGSDEVICDTLAEAKQQFPPKDRKDIKVIDLTIWPSVVTNSTAAANVSQAQMQQALHIAAQELEAGVRYELRVQFVPIEYSFIGEGI